MADLNNKTLFALLVRIGRAKCEVISFAAKTQIAQGVSSPPTDAFFTSKKALQLARLLDTAWRRYIEMSDLQSVIDSSTADRAYADERNRQLAALLDQPHSSPSWSSQLRAHPRLQQSAVDALEVNRLLLEIEACLDIGSVEDHVRSHLKKAKRQRGDR